MLTLDSASASKSCWDKAVEILNSNQKAIAFVIATIVFYLTQKNIDARFFLGDARNYWQLSSYILNFTFPENIRGYFFPLLLSPAKYLSETFPQLGYLPLRALQAITYSYILSILLPNLFLKILGGHTTLARRLVVPCLAAAFFPGLISYPLSDLPAFALTLASIHLLISAEQKTSRTGVFSTLFAAGVLAYGAYNTRPIYIFSMIALVTAIPFIVFVTHTFSKRMMAMLIFSIGAATCSIPQAMINHKHYQSLSPMVIAKVGETSLFATQLKWGITIQRYETQLDKNNEKASGIYYFDPAGEEFFNSRGLHEITATVPWYLGMVISEPVVFGKIFFRHLINGIDVRDPAVYTTSPSIEKRTRSAMSISLFFLGSFLLIRAILEKPITTLNPAYKKSSKLFWLTVLVIPVVAIIPGAIETRFFFPLQALCYSAIAFKITLPTSKNLFTIKSCVLASVYVTLVLYSVMTTNTSMLCRTSMVFESHKAAE